MTADIIQANYEALTTVADKFNQQSEVTSQTKQALLRVMNQLQAGGWIGEGSDAFFSEMEGDVLPGVGRLIEALAQAGQVTGQIKQILQGADEEASACFRNDAGPGGSAEMGAGVGVAGGGSSWNNGFTPGGANALQNLMNNYGFSSGGTFGNIPGGNDYGIPGDWLSGVSDSLQGYMGNNYNNWGIPQNWLSGVSGGAFGDGNHNDWGIPHDWLSEVTDSIGEPTEAEPASSADQSSGSSGGSSGGGSGGGEQSKEESQSGGGSGGGGSESEEEKPPEKRPAADRGSGSTEINSPYSSRGRAYSSGHSSGGGDAAESAGQQGGGLRYQPHSSGAVAGGGASIPARGG